MSCTTPSGGPGGVFFSEVRVPVERPERIGPWPEEFQLETESELRENSKLVEVEFPLKVQLFRCSYFWLLKSRYGHYSENNPRGSHIPAGIRA